MRQVLLEDVAHTLKQLCVVSASELPHRLGGDHPQHEAGPRLRAMYSMLQRALTPAVRFWRSCSSPCSIHLAPSSMSNLFVMPPHVLSNRLMACSRHHHTPVHGVLQLEEIIFPLQSRLISREMYVSAQSRKQHQAAPQGVRRRYPSPSFPRTKQSSVEQEETTQLDTIRRAENREMGPERLSRLGQSSHARGGADISSVSVYMF